MEQSPSSEVIVTQLVKKFTSFMKPEFSLQCSQRLTTNPYSEPDKFSPQLPTLFL